jgi:hypothetical protein
MVKFSRYNSFDELKSAGNLSKNADAKLFAEYKRFIDLLKGSFSASSTKYSKATEKKR